MKCTKTAITSVILVCNIAFFSVISLAKDAIVINDPEWAPYFYAGKANAPDGFAKEIIATCLRKNNYNFIFKFHPINRMRVSMERGLIDINIYSYKASREDFIEFGKEVMYRSTYIPVVLKDSDIEINSLKDFDKYKLGHQLGLRYSDEYFQYVERRRKEGTLDEAPTNISNLQKLMQKRIDIFVASKGSVEQDAKQHGILDKIKILDFIIRDSHYFMSVSKKSPRITNKTTFLKQFDECLRELKANKTYCAIAEKYSIYCDPNSPDPTISD